MRPQAADIVTSQGLSRKLKAAVTLTNKGLLRGPFMPILLRNMKMTAAPLLHHDRGLQ